MSDWKPNMTGLFRSNEESNREASARQVAQATAAIDVLVDLAFATHLRHGREHRAYKALDRQIRALRIRIDNPTDSLVQLAEKAGLTKDAYWRLLQRGLDAAQPEGDKAQ